MKNPPPPSEDFGGINKGWHWLWGVAFAFAMLSPVLVLMVVLWKIVVVFQ